jgi:hypothetical protein
MSNEDRIVETHLNAALAARGVEELKHTLESWTAEVRKNFDKYDARVDGLDRRVTRLNTLASLGSVLLTALGSKVFGLHLPGIE